MSSMKKYRFEIYYFNAETKEVEVTAKMTTRPIPEERLLELVKLEMQKAKQPCCCKLLNK
jgi:hypothetical protein